MRALSLVAYIFMCILSVSIAAYAFIFFLTEPNPDLLVKFRRLAPAGHAHVFASGVALLVGPLQFHERFRQRFLAAHRVSGRVYVLAVLIGGLSGGYLAPYADHGLVAQLGFAGLATTWLASTTFAVRAVRAGDIVRHRQWMLAKLRADLCRGDPALVPADRHDRRL